MKIHVEEEYLNPSVNLLLSYLDEEDFKEYCRENKITKGYDYLKDYLTEVDVRAEQFVAVSEDFMKIAKISDKPLQTFLYLYITLIANIYELDIFFNEINAKLGYQFPEAHDDFSEYIFNYFDNRDFQQSGLSEFLNMLYDSILDYAAENAEGGEFTTFAMENSVLTDIISDTIEDVLSIYIEDFLLDFLMAKFSLYIDTKSGIINFKFLDVLYDYFEITETGTFEQCLAYLKENEYKYKKTK
jgi:hypothetical protein